MSGKRVDPMSGRAWRYGRGRRRRSLAGVQPLLWAGGVLGVIVILAAISLWRSADLRAPSASSVVPRDREAGNLLPLAEPQRPLRGSHNAALVPRQTPAPREAPANMSLPRLDMPSTSHDFGQIPKRPDVAYVFAVQNAGTADLEIRDLSTSCGCTTAELSSSVIPPGQRADLTVTFDPDLHPTQGSVERLVWFGTNDPTQPWVEVRISADVRP